ncbi:hypothetical protein SUNI508_05477 [Seiridium unicorne]|uniref:Uncharacterized protein n=1 Tax=Seiridium unicorne TaxID=138068 RepID=A0ABR2V4V0_9PEZI
MASESHSEQGRSSFLQWTDCQKLFQITNALKKAYDTSPNNAYNISSWPGNPAGMDVTAPATAGLMAGQTAARAALPGGDDSSVQRPEETVTDHSSAVTGKSQAAFENASSKELKERVAHLENDISTSRQQQLDVGWKTQMEEFRLKLAIAEASNKAQVESANKAQLELAHKAQVEELRMKLANSEAANKAQLEAAHKAQVEELRMKLAIAEAAVETHKSRAEELQIRLNEANDRISSQSKENHEYMVLLLKQLAVKGTEASAAAAARAATASVQSKTPEETSVIAQQQLLQFQHHPPQVNQRLNHEIALDALRRVQRELYRAEPCANEGCKAKETKHARGLMDANMKYLEWKRRAETLDYQVTHKQGIIEIWQETAMRAIQTNETLMKTINAPVLNLASHANHMGDVKAYHIQAVRLSQTEVGALADIKCVVEGLDRYSFRLVAWLGLAASQRKKVYRAVKFCRDLAEHLTLVLPLNIDASYEQVPPTGVGIAHRMKDRLDRLMATADLEQGIDAKLAHYSDRITKNRGYMEMLLSILTAPTAQKAEEYYLRFTSAHNVQAEDGSDESEIMDPRNYKWSENVDNENDNDEDIVPISTRKPTRQHTEEATDSNDEGDDNGEDENGDDNGEEDVNDVGGDGDGSEQDNGAGDGDPARGVDDGDAAETSQPPSATRSRGQKRRNSDTDNDGATSSKKKTATRASTKAATAKTKTTAKAKATKNTKNTKNTNTRGRGAAKKTA